MNLDCDIQDADTILELIFIYLFIFLQVHQNNELEISTAPYGHRLK